MTAADPASSSFAFDTDTSVVRTAPGRYRGRVNHRWDIGTVPNGGYVLSLALAGIRDAVEHRHPLSVTGHYLGPCVAGDVEIEVDVLKRGRTLSTAEARLVQDGRVKLAVLASYGDLDAQEGATIVAASPPDIPAPDECGRRDARMRSPFAVPPAIFDIIDFRPSPSAEKLLMGEGGGAARIEGWIRFADGRPVDVHALPLLCDAMPPAVFAAMRTGWVPTLELTVHVRGVPVPGWLRARVATRFLVDGLCEEDCELWDGDGRLVAMSRQMARVLSP